VFTFLASLYVAPVLIYRNISKKKCKFWNYCCGHYAGDTNYEYFGTLPVGVNTNPSLAHCETVSTNTHESESSIATHATVANSFILFVLLFKGRATSWQDSFSLPINPRRKLQQDARHRSNERNRATKRAEYLQRFFAYYYGYFTTPHQEHIMQCPDLRSEQGWPHVSRARHWRGSREIPLIMLGCSKKVFYFIDIILDKRSAS
jgi:hypothetical protein